MAILLLLKNKNKNKATKAYILILHKQIFLHAKQICDISNIVVAYNIIVLPCT